MGQAKIKADAEVKIAEAKAKIDRLRIEKEEQQKIREMKEKQYERAHQLKLKQIEEENAKKQREAEAEMERRKQAHAQRLKQMQIDKEERDKNRKIKQKEQSLNSITAEMNKLDELIDADIIELELEKKDLERTTKELEVKQEWIHKFETYKEYELQKKSDELQLKTAKMNFDRDDQAIKAAIDTTGQHEGNVAKFLMLTHSLLGATVATTAHSNKLEAKIATFDELIARECHDKLSIEQYFYQQNLIRFIPILAECSQKYVNVDQLECDEEEEYEEILEILQNGLQKKLEIESEEKNNDDIDEEKMEEVNNTESKPQINEELKGEELAKHLLTKWGLIKKWDKMKENEWMEPKDWKDLIEDDAELKELGFKG